MRPDELEKELIMSWVSWPVIGLAGLTSTIAAVAITGIIALVLGQAGTLLYRKFFHTTRRAEH